MAISTKGICVSIFAACCSLAWCAFADQAPMPAAESNTISQQQDSVVKTPAEVEVPMDVNEPMQGGMMKKGMMKSDVKKSAEKKDEKMKERLKREEESMPPMPAKLPQKQ